MERGVGGRNGGGGLALSILEALAPSQLIPPARGQCLDSGRAWNPGSRGGAVLPRAPQPRRARARQDSAHAMRAPPIGPCNPPPLPPPPHLLRAVAGRDLLFVVFVAGAGHVPGKLHRPLHGPNLFRGRPALKGRHEILPRLRRERPYVMQYHACPARVPPYMQCVGALRDRKWHIIQSLRVSL